MKNDSALFYTCSLIEYIARQQKLKRSEAVAKMGSDIIKKIYDYADVFHCEPIEKTADEFISRCGITASDYDNVSKCRYEVPDYWTIGEVYSRLIEDQTDNGGNVIDVLIEVYTSWISDAISDYNTDFYYQSRDYIYECYKEGKVCA